jgi:hypothetical protein
MNARSFRLGIDSLLPLVHGLCAGDEEQKPPTRQAPEEYANAYNDHVCISRPPNVPDIIK